MTTWEQTRVRITSEASELAPVKVLVTILAAPFFVIGLLIAFIWFVLTLAWQAAWVGVDVARRSLKR